MSEWLLVAVSSILHGCQQSASSVESLGELRESLATALNSSLDLLSSAGRSVQDGMLLPWVSYLWPGGTLI